MHHELNHFILGSYFGVSSALDCGADEQGKFLHEGTFGSVIPQMCWHSWYGVGYEPDFAGQLFTSSSVRGRIHTDNASRMTLNNFLCVNYDNEDSSGSLGQQPYDAGRLAGQPLGSSTPAKEEGDVATEMARYLTDTDALISYYWAVDLVRRFHLQGTL